MARTICQQWRDITGQRFNRLVPQWPVGANRDRKMMWLCSCDCGRLVVVAGKQLRTGETQSCGCALIREVRCKKGHLRTARNTGSESYGNGKHANRCLECRRERDRNRPNKESRREFVRKWRRENSEYLKQFDKDRYNAHVRRLMIFKMNPLQYEELLASQDFKCAGCGESFVMTQATPQIDHDHSCCDSNTNCCGECNRGLLCGKCNATLGMASDSISRLEGLIAYLRRHGKS